MTDRRDLKRRVRARQARTGESYVTALRQTRAQRSAPVPVLELVDGTAAATAIGLGCRVSVFPGIAARVEVAAALARLRAALEATRDDRALTTMRRAVLLGEPVPTVAALRPLDAYRVFLDRARGGIGGMTPDGHALALPCVGELVVFALLPTPGHATTRPLLLVAAPGDLAGAVGDVRALAAGP